MRGKADFRTVSFTIYGDHSRCLNKALKGTLEFRRVSLHGLTDESNMARGSSLLPLVAALGQVAYCLIHHTPLSDNKAPGLS